jgi:hypothetical protein
MTITYYVINERAKLSFVLIILLFICICCFLFPREAREIHNDEEIGTIGLGYPSAWIRYSLSPLQSHRWTVDITSISGLAGLYCLFAPVLVLARICFLIRSSHLDNSSAGEHSRIGFNLYSIMICFFYSFFVVQIISFPVLIWICYHKSYLVANEKISNHVWFHSYHLFFISQCLFVIPISIVSGVLAYVIINLTREG